MTRTSFFLALLLAFLMAAMPAWAKGVDRGIVTGPGLAGPLRIGPDDERTSASLDLIREGSGVNVALIAELPGDFRPDPPPGDLGPRYRLAWHLPEDDSEVVQDLYPYAAGAPVVHTPAQKHVVRTGWRQAPAFLKDALVGIGLPRDAPDEWTWWWWAAAPVAVIAIAGVVVVWRRRAAGARAGDRRPTSSA
ncbi:hypothetical protein AB0B45_15870 [Nonomuraea sp. NPDC049152]|uniref:hypothetical protein n=1 Tax=Nonomuraea sp. NPDC049152 TaxID=3154350 RepID=UPI0033D77BD7